MTKLLFHYFHFLFHPNPLSILFKNIHSFWKSLKTIICFPFDTFSLLSIPICRRKSAIINESEFLLRRKLQDKNPPVIRRWDDAYRKDVLILEYIQISLLSHLSLNHMLSRRVYLPNVCTSVCVHVYPSVYENVFVHVCFSLLQTYAKIQICDTSLDRQNGVAVVGRNTETTTTISLTAVASAGFPNGLQATAAAIETTATIIAVNLSVLSANRQWHLHFFKLHRSTTRQKTCISDTKPFHSLPLSFHLFNSPFHQIICWSIHQQIIPLHPHRHSLSSTVFWFAYLVNLKPKSNT